MDNLIAAGVSEEKLFRILTIDDTRARTGHAHPTADASIGIGIYRVAYFVKT